MFKAVIGRCVRSVSEGKPFEFKQFLKHPTYVKRFIQPNNDHQGLQSRNTNWIRKTFWLDAWLGSKIYGLLVAIRRSRFLSTAQSLPVPVISIGNLTWGGNGKTPMTETISHIIQTEYSKISLGYSADELLQMQENIPKSLFGTGSNRLQVAKSVLDANTQLQSKIVCILDDGLQFFSLKKDLELTMVNALDPFGNGSLIPLGKLRELPQDALERSHIVAIHHSNLVPRETVLNLTSQLSQCMLFVYYYSNPVDNSNLQFIETSMEPRFFKNALTGTKIALEGIQNKSVVLFCGLGQPEAFYHTIAQMNPLSITLFEFLDHHNFSTKEVQAIIKDAVVNTSVVVTTEKDFHRCQKLLIDSFSKSSASLLVLHSELKITKGSHILQQQLDRLTQIK